MIKTYSIHYYGDEERIRQATRIADHIFRQWYNVYGGKRVYSKKGVCHMNYTAYWFESGLYCYSWSDIYSLIEKKLLKLGYAVIRGKGIIQIWDN